MGGGRLSPVRRAAGRTKKPAVTPKAEGWHGWDEYAPFYDWENARTLEIGRAHV